MHWDNNSETQKTSEHDVVYHDIEYAASVEAPVICAPEEIVAQGQEQLEQEVQELQSYNSRFDLLQTLSTDLVSEYEDTWERHVIDEAVSMRREALRITPDSHPKLPLALERLAYALNIRDSDIVPDHDLDECIKIRRNALDLLSSDRNLRSIVQQNQGSDLIQQFQRTQEECYIDEAIALYREAMQELDSKELWPLVGLTTSYFDKFEENGDPIYLHECVPLLAEARHFTLQNTDIDPEYFSILHDVASALQAEYQRGGGLQHLDAAIELHRRAVHLRSYTDSRRPFSLQHLANALQERYEHDSEVAYLEEAISLHRETLQLRPGSHSDRHISLNFLAVSLHAQFSRTGDYRYIVEAAECGMEALELTPEPHPDRSMSLTNVANTLLIQFDHDADINHLEKAIDLGREALKLKDNSHPDYFSLLSHLAISLRTQFQHDPRKLQYLEEAIALHRQALELISNKHPFKSMALNNLGNALVDKIEHDTNSNYLEEAIDLYREASKLRPEPHPRHFQSLNNLATALQTQFELGGGLNHLEEAIQLHRQALRLKPKTHPHYLQSLNNFAAANQTLFEHGGGLNYLDEAIQLYKQALELMPTQHVQRSMFLNNLANALLQRFENFGNNDDLQEAVELHRQALQLRPDTHPDHSQSLNNLATALLDQFVSSNEVKIIDEAVQLHRRALQSSKPAPHPDYYITLNNLANALHGQFEYGSRTAHLEEAIKLLEPILEISSKQEPTARGISVSQPRSQLQQSHLTSYRVLGKLYITAYNALERGANDYLSKAIHAFSLVLHFPLASPFVKLDSAIMWAEYADKNHHPSVMDAYDFCIQLLPQVTSIGHSMYQRQKNLFAHIQNKNLAGGAANYALRVQRFDKAIEYLEAARATLWFSLLQYRPPLDELCTVAPELGRELEQIAEMLDRASHSVHSETINLMRESDQDLRLTNLTIEWNAKLEQVRKISGFENFMGHRRFSSLQAAALDCPIIVLIADDDGSYCLIITSMTTRYFAVPILTSSKLRSMASSIRRSAKNSFRANDTYDSSPHYNSPTLLIPEGGSRLNAKRKGMKPSEPDAIFRQVLQELWVYLVKTVIDILHIEKTSDRHCRPTLQWCPTGLFTFLPIHAAGIYDISELLPDTSAHESTNIMCPGKNDCAFDYIVSSYTPTIGALLAAENSRSRLPDDFKLLAVVAGTDLYHTTLEVQKIKDRVPIDCLIKVGVDGIRANVETVLDLLPKSSIVHFACHGIQDKLNPLDSGLNLADGKLTIAKIMSKSPSNGSLAFLCACETAMGDEGLPDEAISMGASLLFSGFSSVIATMWKIMDRHGPTIADAFYEELFRGPDGSPTSIPNFNRSAQALDFAVQKLRDSGVPFHEWVPFVHLGKAT